MLTLQSQKRLTNGFFKVCWKRLGLHHGPDLSPHAGQTADIFRVQCVQKGIDLAGQPVKIQKLPKTMGRRCKAGGHPNARGQLRDHFTQTGILTPHRLHIRHAQLLKRNDQSGLTEKIRHTKLQS